MLLFESIFWNVIPSNPVSLLLNALKYYFRCCDHYVGIIFVLKVCNIGFVFDNLSVCRWTLSNSVAWNRHWNLCVHSWAWVSIDTLHKLFGKYAYLIMIIIIFFVPVNIIWILKIRSGWFSVENWVPLLYYKKLFSNSKITQKMVKNICIGLF